MKYVISKEFHFAASHVLGHLHEGHPCTRLHGHNYIVIFHFEDTQLNEPGFVIDYRELDAIKKWIDETLDHKHLNDVFALIEGGIYVDKMGVQRTINPSAENIAKLLFDTWQTAYPQLKGVTVKESMKTEAYYGE